MLLPWGGVGHGERLQGQTQLGVVRWDQLCVVLPGRVVGVVILRSFAGVVAYIAGDT